jgi:capsular exopolysaccharide synthesis family protein
MQNNPTVVAQQKKIADLEAQLATIPDATLTKEMQDHETRITQLEASLKGTLAVDARRLILDQLSREDNLLAGLKSQINDQKRLLLDQLGQERNRLNNLQTAAIQQQNQILNQLATEHTQLATTQRTLEALSPSLQKGLSRQITVIDPATNAPLQTGNTLLIVLAAAVAGMVLGLTLAFLFEYFDDRIRTPEQLGEATGARVWGLLPKPTDAPVLGRLKAGATSLTDQRIAESFRQLSVQLLPNSTTNLGSVLVSNFEPGDAAARIASNLAITLARAGKRVLLIDGDLQQPLLGELFELGDRKGLADWLGDGATQPDIVSIEWMPGLSVLPVGSSDNNSVPEMIWTRMDTLLKNVQAQNDLIVVAGPPLTTSADSVFFAEHVDGVLAVAQRNHTTRQKARQAIENLRALGVQILGVVLATAGAPRLNAVTMPAHREMPAPSSTPLISGERSFAIESPKPDTGAAFGAILASKTDASKTKGTGVDKTQI